MRRCAALFLIVFTAACGSLQSVAVTPQQRLYAATGDYIVYGQIVLQIVSDPLTLPETRATLKDLDNRAYNAIRMARTAYDAGDLTEVTLVLAETGLRELRSRLVAEGRLKQ
jgi:hypothetical protein